MHLGTKRQSETVPLRSAVLCVDCESVSDTRTEQCPVCGSHSLLGLARVVGGSLVAYSTSKIEELESVSLLDVQISIELKRAPTRELNRAVEGIASLVGPMLGQGRASFHIDVEPVEDGGMKYEMKAA